MADRPLKFCMLTTFYPPYHFGGDGLCVYRLSEALAARGHRVDVVHSADAFHLQHAAEPPIAFSHHPNVRRFALRSRRPTLAALAAHQLGRPGLYSREIRRILEGDDYDVVHFHNVSLLGGPGLLRLPGRGTNGRRAVKLYTAHEYWLVCPTHVLFRFNREACTRRTCLRCTLHARRPPQAWRHTGLTRRCLGAVDCLLMPSRFARDQHRALGIDRPMAVLPHFVPRPAAEDPPLPAAPERPFFLYTGRLEKLKGVQDLLALFADYRDADLVIAGDGSYAGVLRRQAKELPHVRWAGALHPAQLSGLYRRAIALLAPSLCYETFGLTVAEAFAHGTPAIVRRHGALTELIDETGAGLAFRTRQECRQAMERLSSDAQLRASMGERGRDAARRLWSVTVHLERYFQLIEPFRSAFSGRQEPVAQ